MMKSGTVFAESKEEKSQTNYDSISITETETDVSIAEAERILKSIISYRSAKAEKQS